MSTRGALTLEEVLSQVLASDNEDNDIKIESEDFDYEEDVWQGDISEEEEEVFTSSRCRWYWI